CERADGGMSGRAGRGDPAPRGFVASSKAREGGRAEDAVDGDAGLGALVGAGARGASRAAPRHRQAERARHPGVLRATGGPTPPMARRSLPAGDPGLQLGFQALAQVHAASANLHLHPDLGSCLPLAISRAETDVPTHGLATGLGDYVMAFSVPRAPK